MMLLSKKKLDQISKPRFWLVMAVGIWNKSIIFSYYIHKRPIRVQSEMKHTFPWTSAKPQSEICMLYSSIDGSFVIFKKTYLFVCHSEFDFLTASGNSYENASDTKTQTCKLFCGADTPRQSPTDFGDLWMDRRVCLHAAVCRIGTLKAISCSRSVPRTSIKIIYIFYQETVPCCLFNSFSPHCW